MFAFTDTIESFRFEDENEDEDEDEAPGCYSMLLQSTSSSLPS